MKGSPKGGPFFIVLFFALSLPKIRFFAPAD
jgi:hypothetical protein